MEGGGRGARVSLRSSAWGGGIAEAGGGGGVCGVSAAAELRGPPRSPAAADKEVSAGPPGRGSLGRVGGVAQGRRPATRDPADPGSRRFAPAPAPAACSGRLSHFLPTPPAAATNGKRREGAWRPAVVAAPPGRGSPAAGLGEAAAPRGPHRGGTGAAGEHPLGVSEGSAPSPLPPFTSRRPLLGACSSRRLRGAAAVQTPEGGIDGDYQAFHRESAPHRPFRPVPRPRSPRGRSTSRGDLRAAACVDPRLSVREHFQLAREHFQHVWREKLRESSPRGLRGSEAALVRSTPGPPGPSAEPERGYYSRLYHI